MDALYTKIHRTRGRASLRMLGIALTLFLVLNALTPLLQQAAAEDRDDNPIISQTIQGQQFQQDPGNQDDPNGDGNGGILADPPLQVVDEDPNGDGDGGDDGDGQFPQADQVQDFAQAEEPGPGSIYINKHECLGTYDHDIYQLAANCFEPTNNPEFQVYGPNFQQTYYGDFGADNLTPGNYTIRELIPQGYGTPVVFCKVSDYLGNDNGMYEVVVYDGYYEFQLAGDTQFYCDWFNVPQGTPNSNTVFINKHYCTPGFDAYNADIYDLAYNCNTSQDGVYFEVSDGNSVLASGTTGDSLPGMLEFDGLPSGNLYVSEEIPDGYQTPVVYCKVIDADQTETAEELYQLSNESTISWYAYSNQTLFCDWFNVPSDDYSVIQVIKYNCTDYDNSWSFQDFQYNCTTPGEGIDFKLDGASSGNPGDYLTDAEVKVSWTVNESDTWYLMENPVPDGYGTPVVFCDIYRPFDEQVQSYDGYSVDSEARIQFDLEVGQYITCYWYNIPNYDTTITVTKYVCPEGTAYDGDPNYYQSECTEVLEGVDFSLSGDSAGDLGTYTTDASGQVSWSGLDPDYYYLSEDIPYGYGEPVVVCGFSAYYNGAVYDGFPQRYETHDGTVELDSQTPNSKWFCWFYNIPNYGSTIEVYKYNCYDYDQSWSYDDYVQYCTETPEGIDFKLDGASSGNPGDQLTDANGYVKWDVNEADHWYLSELEVPEGYGKPVVFCVIYQGDSGAQDYYDASSWEDGYRIEFDLDEDYSIKCYWFNVPEYGSTIEVFKYNCYDYDPSWSLDEYHYNCQETPEGIEFKLDGASSGNPGEQYTDADGHVSWYVNEADHWYLSEMEIPDGYGKPVIFCEIYYDGGSSTNEYDAAQWEDGYRIEFDLDEDYSIKCYWFNIPEYDGSIDVYKYTCPEGVDYSWSVEDFLDYCDSPTEGIPFKLDGASSGNPGEQYTDNSGHAGWKVNESDHWYLYEQELPDGYGKPVVFCEYYGESPKSYDVNNDYRIEFDLDEGYSIKCYWFNIPTDYDTSITIYKWLCPEGFDLYSDDAEYLCDYAYNGVTFKADGPNGYYSQSDTGDSIDGAVYFGDLEAGTYEITESLPSDIDYGFVISCQGSSAPVPLIFPRYNTQWGGPFTTEIYEGEDIVCNWYNVPKDSPKKTKLTIVKYLCDTYVSDLTCSIYTGGQEFTVTDASDDTNSYDVVTGPDGKKTLLLPAGEWLLDEVGASWCYAESDDLNQYGQVVTKYGHESVVYVYNCKTPTKNPPVKNPPVKQGPPEVTKFPNTGAGTTAGTTFNSAGIADLGGQAAVLLIVAQGLVLIALRKRAALRLATRRINR